MAKVLHLLTITNVILQMFGFLCTENILNSDPKAKVLSNNLPLKYDPLLYLTTQQHRGVAVV